MTIDRNDSQFRLSKIRSLVRVLTGRRSTNQISDDEVDIRINQFYTLKLPFIVDSRLFRGSWEFSTLKYASEYYLEKEVLSIGNVAFVNGTSIRIFKDDVLFYQTFPKSFSGVSSEIGTGDGATVAFSGTLNVAQVTGSVVITDDTEVFEKRPDIFITTASQASPCVITTEKAHNLSSGDAVQITDMGVGMSELENRRSTVTVLSSTTFQLDSVDSSEFESYLMGGRVIPLSVVLLEGSLGGTGRITVSSGAYSITFDSAPSSGQAIKASYESQTAGQPTAALLTQDKLIFTPMPDTSYLVQIPCKKSPPHLLNDQDELIHEGFSYLIAYGTAIDLLNEFGQHDAAENLQIEFRRLKNLASIMNARETTNTRSTPSF